MTELRLEVSWHNRLKDSFSDERMKELSLFLKNEQALGKIIYPPFENIFNAFTYTHFQNVKVVIIGQDPYHGEGEAHGLSFSVKNGVKIPPSLKNIYKELNSDLKLNMPKKNGCLIPWAERGVLLLNSVLTVEKDKPASHRKKGWEHFTDEVIQLLNREKNNLVFLLWGKDAKLKGEKIDRSKHCVLESGHPSPFSAKLFHGHHHFSECNAYLEKHDIKPIDWRLDEAP
ncbi:MAG: uracil-DNA glycosylase [Bacteriovoracaceae bacterium]